MSKTIKNLSGYAFHASYMGELEGHPNDRPRHRMTVEFVTDMVPGAFYNPEDLMNWIAQNPYVATVTLETN